MIMVITPDRVVIGGGIAAAFDLLLEPIEAELRAARPHDGARPRARSCRRSSGRGPGRSAPPSTAPRRPSGTIRPARAPVGAARDDRGRASSRSTARSSRPCASGSRSLAPGARLPSDAELCAEFGVSRMTARNAMQRLAEDGLIAREAGPRQLRGGAAGPPPGEPADDLQPGDAARRTGPELAGAGPGRPPAIRRPRRAAWASRRGSRSSTCVGCGWPTTSRSPSRSTVLIGASADAVMTRRPGAGSLHETLARAGFVLRRGTGTITAAAATAEDARSSACGPAIPCSSSGGSSSTAHGRRIEATESRYAADRYGLDVQFDVEAARPSIRETAPRRARPAGVTRHEPATTRRRSARPRRPGRAGRITIEDGRIAAVELDEARPATDAPVPSRPGSSTSTSTAGAATTRWAIAAALDGMARRAAAARRDVVPADGRDRAARRRWPPSPSASAPGCPDAPADGAEPLGFNLEGPFLAPARRGAHDPAHLRAPADVAAGDARAAPRRAAPDHRSPRSCPAPRELDRAGSRDRGVAVSIGHSAATARRGAGRLCGRRHAPRPTCSTR